METTESKNFYLFGCMCFTSVLLCAVPLVPAFSAPLDKDACANLSQEMQNLKALDVDKLMEKGPEWAISNLSQNDLSLIRRYINLDEQIKFRCLPPGSLVRLHAPDEDEGEDATEAAENDGAAKLQPGSKQTQHETTASAKPKQVKAPKKAAKPREAHIGVKPANSTAAQ